MSNALDFDSIPVIEVKTVTCEEYRLQIQEAVLQASEGLSCSALAKIVLAITGKQQVGETRNDVARTLAIRLTANVRDGKTNLTLAVLQFIQCNAKQARENAK